MSLFSSVQGLLSPVLPIPATPVATAIIPVPASVRRSVVMVLMLIAQVAMGVTVVPFQRPVQPPVLSAGHGIFMGGVVPRSQIIMGRLMVFIEIVMYARVGTGILLFVIMGKDGRRPGQQASERHDKEGEGADRWSNCRVLSL